LDVGIICIGINSVPQQILCYCPHIPVPATPPCNIELQTHHLIAEILVVIKAVENILY